MSEILKQKISSLYVTEPKFSTALQKLTESTKNQQLKDFFKKVHTQSFERVSELGKVVGLLKIDLKSQTVPAQEALLEELESFKQLKPSNNTDLQIAGVVQQFMMLLSVDYSYAANIIYEKNEELNTVTLLTQAYEKILTLNEELSSIVSELFKEESSSKEEPKKEPLKEKPPEKDLKQGIIEKIKKKTGKIKDAIIS